jgi:hypothetical protein
MMRIRTIKPEWLEDERMAEASSDARVLSIALILLADDVGRGRLNKATAARCFPADPATFDRAFAELQGWFVERYEVRGQGYFAIVNFRKHQKIDRPSKPRTPEPPGDHQEASDSECLRPKSAVQEITPNEDTRETLASPREDSSSPRRGFVDGPGPGPGPGPTTKDREPRARARVASDVPAEPPVRHALTPARLWAMLDDAWHTATGERMPGLFTPTQRMDLERLTERHGADAVAADLTAFAEYHAGRSPLPSQPWRRYLDEAGAWTTKGERMAALSREREREARPVTGILDADETERMMQRKMRGGH